MNRTSTPIRVATLVLLLAAVSASMAFGAEPSELSHRCQMYERCFTPPGDLPSSQTTLIALMAAAAELGTDDLTEIEGVFSQMSPYAVYLTASDTSYTWDTDHWVGESRATYTYNTSNFLTQMIYQHFDGSTWNNFLKVTYNYDGSNRLSTSTSQSWQGGAWVNQGLSTMSYDGSGNLSQILSQAWQGGAWVNSSLATYTYSSGRVSEVVTQQWQTSAWVNLSHVMYTYTPSGFLSVWTMQTWQTSEWVNTYRFSYTYDVNDLEIESLSQMWGGSDWENTSKSEYSYDGSSHEILELSSMWVDPDWLLTDADTSKWSGDLNTEVVTYQILSDQLSRTQYTYDAHDNEIENVQQSFVDPDWINESRNVYVYELSLDAELSDERLPSLFSLGQNYPNPFNPSTSIRYSLVKRSDVTLAILNVLGEEVKTLESGIQPPGVHEALWDGTDDDGHPVATGIYFYRITAGGISETKKMVLMK
jgi:hypothetical protein